MLVGLVGVIPAMSIMTPEQNPPDGPVRLSYGQLVLWSLALAFLGVFCAVPLRTQTILKEKLRFPSGTATANVIRTLHAVPDLDDAVEPLYGVDVILEEPGKPHGPDPSLTWKPNSALLAILAILVCTGHHVTLWQDLTEIDTQCLLRRSWWTIATPFMACTVFAPRVMVRGI